jgi:hypothetical protein
MSGKTVSKQAFLLKRWAETPEYSPLSGVPDLWEVGAQYSTSEDDDEIIDVTEDEIAVEEWEEFVEKQATRSKTPLLPGALKSTEEVERELSKSRRRALERAEDSGFRRRALADSIEEWFVENFEPVAPNTSYDKYMWGGPYDVREVISQFFGDELFGEDEEVIDIAVERIEARAREWVPVGSRLGLSRPQETPKSSQEAYELVQKNVQALKELLSHIPEQPAGMGHNQPPEPIDDHPLDSEDREELAIAVQVIETQAVEPSDQGKSAKEAANVIETKAQKVKSWLARQGDVFATEVFKESGKQFGKWMPRAFWMYLIDRMLSVTETVTAWLKLVSPHF